MFHSDFMSGWDEDVLQHVLDNCDNGSQIPDGGLFCTPWLKYKIPVTEGGSDAEDEAEQMIQAITSVLPPAVNTQVKVY